MAMTDDLGPGNHIAVSTPEDLFRQYYPAVVSFFLRRGFPVEESRDLAQDTFLRVYRHMESFRGESSVETWLFQIAMNQYKNAIRSLNAQKRDAQEVSLDATPGGEVMDWGPEEKGGQLESLLSEERARLLRSAFQDLPPQMRQAVVLRVDGDMKYREIAKVMRVSIETVKAHLYQARQQLRDRLADYYDTDDEL